ncbi:hypothetical protein [Legionella gratiana]|nr:hypothetical protein [Legionella gratiana]
MIKKLEIVTQEIMDNICFAMEEEILPKIDAHALKDGDLDIIDSNLYRGNNFEVVKRRISAAVWPILSLLLNNSNPQQGKDAFFRALKKDLTQIIIEIKNNKISPSSFDETVSTSSSTTASLF